MKYTIRYQDGLFSLFLGPKELISENSFDSLCCEVNCMLDTLKHGYYTQSYVNYSRACKVTGKTIAIQLPTREYERYITGDYTTVQELFPQVPPEDITFLVTGISSEGAKHIS